MGNAREAGSLRVGRWTGGMWVGFVGGGARRTVVGVEGARGWYVSRCLRMELSRRRLSWSWSLFTWRRELRIPSLGARAGGYATAPSERTTKVADSLLAEPRLVVWSRTTSLPPPVGYPPRCFLRQAHTTHVKVTPHPFPETLFPKAGSDGPLRGTLQQGKRTGNMAFSRRRMPSTGRLLQLAHLPCHLDPALTPGTWLGHRRRRRVGLGGSIHRYVSCLPILARS